MKIDISDLFDDLFAMAIFARREFVASAIEADNTHERWDAFCRDLSDSYFVALAARRAFQVTHQRIPVLEIKRRIITQRRFGPRGVGLNMWYECPRFFLRREQPSGFSANFRHDDIESVCDFLPRPEHSLILHLGRVPHTEFAIDGPSFDVNVPCSYYCKHGTETMFSGRVTSLLETRGEWLVREITLSGTLGFHEWEQPRWIDTRELQTIDPALFMQMWTLAVANDQNPG